MYIFYYSVLSEVTPPTALAAVAAAAYHGGRCCDHVADRQVHPAGLPGAVRFVLTTTAARCSPRARR